MEDTRGFIQASLEQNARNDGFQCCIWYEGKLSGMIGLVHINWANRDTMIGYWLGPEFQGNGIMTRCCRKLIGYAFEELDLNRVEIRVAAENKRSRAIPERLGFVKEGVVREAEWLYDHFVDHVIYGMVRRDWNA